MPRSQIDLASVGLRIRQLRGKLLQEEVAKYLNITQGQLSKIEHGDAAPGLDTLVRLSDKFHRSIDWILKGKEGRKNPRDA
jgi:transcriptional regulator with XRE-family HTH domain